MDSGDFALLQSGGFVISGLAFYCKKPASVADDDVGYTSTTVTVLRGEKMPRTIARDKLYALTFDFAFRCGHFILLVSKQAYNSTKTAKQAL